MQEHGIVTSIISTHRIRPGYLVFKHCSLGFGLRRGDGIHADIQRGVSRHTAWPSCLHRRFCAGDRPMADLARRVAFFLSIFEAFQNKEL